MFYHLQSITEENRFLNDLKCGSKSAFLIEILLYMYSRGNSYLTDKIKENLTGKDERAVTVKH